jgi:cysteine-rich repeat protein
MKTCGFFVFLVITLSLVLPERADLHAASAQPPVQLTTPTSGGRAAVTEWPATIGPDAAMDDPTCPNLVVDPGEDCDDGNEFNGDGCDASCQFEPAVCGNGIFNPGEECDDGNLVANDGCDAECNLEPAVCGNGLLESDEECDDGNTISGDGCDGSCNLEGVTGITLSVGTSTANDTLIAGVPGSLIFKVEAPATIPIAGFMFPMKYLYSNGNIIGPIGLGAGIAYMTASPKVYATVSIVGWNRNWATTATSPSATLLGLVNLGPVPHPWTGSGELWRITFTPLDTGTITIDSTTLPPANELAVFDTRGDELSYQWTSKTITVKAGMPTGNVNGDSIISSSDLIYLVNFLFKAGAPPAQCEAKGDVDCSGIINTADIIKDVNYVFKSGQKPCNVGGLVDAGVWECP